ncbi:MAG: LamG-like jellyroll fold domain-containing protein [Candidatus Paceibacterota bacterium]|jgi:hypothetical protein
MDHFSKKLPKTILFAAIALTILAGVFVLPVANKNNKALADTGLVGYWSFDEGTGMTAADSSGNGNTGTLLNGPVWTTGKKWNALQFDGINDYVDLGSNASLNFGAADNFSISSWININDNTVSSGIYATSDEWPTGDYFNLYYRGSQQKLRFGYNYGGGSAYTSIDAVLPSAMTEGVWHQVVLVKSGTTAVFYYDGSPLTTVTGGQLGAMNTFGGVKRIGKGNANLNYFDGLIDEVKVYNRALTVSEVSADYQGGTFDQVLTSISVSPFSSIIKAGSAKVFTASSQDQNGNSMTGVAVSWSSSSPGVATVNASGVVSGVATGTATITASSGSKSGTAFVVITSSVSPATVTYSGGMITISSGTANFEDVYNMVNDPAVLSKTGTEYTLTSSITIDPGATLTIDASQAGGITLKFNEPAHNTYYIMDKGTLNINNAILTSATGNAWYILSGNDAKVQLDNSDISKCGIDVYPCVKTGEYDVGTTTNTVTWTNLKVHDNLGYYVFFTGNGSYWVNIDNLEAYDLTWRMFDFTQATIRNSKFHDLDPGNGGLTIISWGKGGQVYDSEFYNINTNVAGTGSVFYCKEGGGGCVFQNNHIHDVNLGYIIGFYGSGWPNTTIYKDNLIENSTVSSAVVYWRANQYFGGVDLKSNFNNNILRNISGYRIFEFHSGGQNVRIWNNTLENVTATSGQSFRADYESGQAGGSTYHPGDSANSIIYDMNFPGNIRIYDLDVPGDQSIRGKLLPFVNVNYGSVTVNMPDDYFYDYKYLDVKVVDSSNNPINGATVTIANDTDANYPAINLYRQTKLSVATGTDGHIPLPSDLTNTVAVLDFWKTSAAQQEMTYTITASYGGKTNSIAVTPDSTWYRTNPLVSTNTVTIQLTTAVTPPAVSTADLNSDGHVNSVDFGIMMSFWNYTSKPKADLNQDGFVNSQDLGMLMSQWG